MRVLHRRFPFALVALTTLFAAQAHAGCGGFNPAEAQPLLPPVTSSSPLSSPSMQQDRWLREPAEPAFGNTRMMQAAYLVPVSDRDYSNLPIVGLWKFTMTAYGNPLPPAGPPDGTPIDAGYQTWHTDRTEIMNSGRPADTSNFCMGVWKPTGRSSYKLNHYALSWSGSGATGGAPNTFVGAANIKEEITLSNGDNRFDGTFSIDQYDATGAKLLQHVVGKVSATRITAD